MTQNSFSSITPCIEPVPKQGAMLRRPLRPYLSIKKQALTAVCVDLDGTLIRNDVTRLVFRKYLLLRPYRIFRLLAWYMKGGWSYMKNELAQYVEIGVQHLDYNQPLIDWLLSLREQGMRLFLATASHHKYANAIAAHLGFFEDVFASNALCHLSGKQKRDLLNAVFGVKNYIYCGNAFVDIPVWDAARSVVVVNPPLFLLSRLKKKKMKILAKFFCYSSR